MAFSKVIARPPFPELPRMTTRNPTGRILFGRGHNQGPPLDPMHSWRRHCWQTARKALFRPLPVEVVRRRVARAGHLGLTYARYELLVLGGGEIEAMLFAGDTLVVRAPYAIAKAVPDKAAFARLASLAGCRRFVLTGPDGEETIWTGPPAIPTIIDAAIRVPSLKPLAAPPRKMDRDALQSGLRAHRLSAGSVALIGNGAYGQAWVAASRLAGFVPGSEYFGG
jgi:hypothetical protein